MKARTLMLGIVMMLSLSSFASLATAQEPQPSPWSIAAYSDFRTKETSVVVLRRIGPLEKPFGLKVDLDIEAFAGSNMAGDSVVGVAATYTFGLAKNLDFKIGPATTWQPGQKFRDAGIGLILGVSYRF